MIRPPSSMTMRSAISSVFNWWVITNTLRPTLYSCRAAVDLQLALGVGLAGELVQDQDAGIAQDRSRQRDALLLPARQNMASLAQPRLVAQAALVVGDELMRVRPGGPPLPLPPPWRAARP